eukprot:gene10157-biopygen1741
MPAPRPRHACATQAKKCLSPRHARAAPAPVSCDPSAGATPPTLVRWARRRRGVRWRAVRRGPGGARALHLPRRGRVRRRVVRGQAEWGGGVPVRRGGTPARKLRPVQVGWRADIRRPHIVSCGTQLATCSAQR